MKNLIKILFVLSFLLPVCVQGQAVTWSKWYDYNYSDNEGFDVIETFEEGYLILSNNSTGINTSTILFKTDSKGNLEWQRLFVQNNTGQAGILSYEILQTKDSGFVFCGDSGGDSAFIVRINSLGDLIWIKKYTQVGKMARFFGISLTDDGGFIACGDIYSPFIGYIVKTDSLGNLEWYQTGGHRFYNILQSVDQNYYVTDLNFLYKYTLTGNLIWKSDSIVGSNILSGTNIVQYSPKYIYAAGGLGSMILNKVDSSGSLIWKKEYYKESLGGGPLCLSKDGNFLLAGEIRYLLQFDVAVSKIDPDGNLIFNKRLNLTNTGNYGNIPYSVKATNDSGFIITGFTDYPGSPYRDNALVVKTDSTCYVSKFVNISENSNITLVSFELFQNYPNPFNSSTIIQYFLKNSGKITLTIFDIHGKEIKTLVDSFQNAGTFKYYFNPERLNLSSGIYFYKITSEQTFKVNSKIKKMVYIK